MSSAWWASVPGALLGLAGVLYAQWIVRTNFKEQREWQWASLRQQQHQHEAQLAASGRLEREKHHREVATDALSAGLVAAGRVISAFRDLEAAVVRADEQQHPIPGSAPAETEQIAAERQRCRDALVECEAVSSRLLLLGLNVSHQSVSAFVRLVTDHVGAPRPPLAVTAVDGITTGYSDLVHAASRDGQMIFDAAERPDLGG